MATQKVIMNLRGVPVVLTSELRIPQREREKGLYYYDVRHSDDDFGEPATIERLVQVHHLGTIATTKPLIPEEVRYLELLEEESYQLGIFI